MFVHEILYVSRDGRGYLENCFVPVFGLRLNNGPHAALHVAFMSACIALAFPGNDLAVSWLCLGLLTLVIASYSLRLSNHLVLCWFMLLGICMDSGQGKFAAACARGLVILTYGLAGFHKLNAEYVSTESSWASQFADFYCCDRNIRGPGLRRGFAITAIWGTLLTELALPFLLLIPATRVWGVLAGLLFHFSLALLGIVNFSAVMYAGLLAFIPEQAILESVQRTIGMRPSLAAVVVAFAAAAWIFTPRRANRHCPYRHRWLGWLVQIPFGMLTGFALLCWVHVLALRQALVPPDLGAGRIALLWGMWFVFLLNGLGPYLGIKTEFSFCMFSNLRCQPWRHLVFPAGWRVFRGWHYAEIERIEGLPERCSATADPATLLAIDTLSQASRLRYSPYFLREAARRVAGREGRAPRLQLRYRLNQRSHEIDSSDATAFAAWQRGWRITLFPFVLPKDPCAAHSEQGTLLGREGERQLF